MGAELALGRAAVPAFPDLALPPAAAMSRETELAQKRSNAQSVDDYLAANTALAERVLLSPAARGFFTQHPELLDGFRSQTNLSLPGERELAQLASHQSNVLPRDIDPRLRHYVRGMLMQSTLPETIARIGEMMGSATDPVAYDQLERVYSALGREQERIAAIQERSFTTYRNNYLEGAGATQASARAMDALTRAVESAGTVGMTAESWNTAACSIMNDAHEKISPALYHRRGEVAGSGSATGIFRAAVSREALLKFNQEQTPPTEPKLRDPREDPNSLYYQQPIRPGSQPDMNYLARRQAELLAGQTTQWSGPAAELYHATHAQPQLSQTLTAAEVRRLTSSSGGLQYLSSPSMVLEAVTTYGAMRPPSEAAQVTVPDSMRDPALRAARVGLTLLAQQYRGTGNAADLEHLGRILSPYRQQLGFSQQEYAELFRPGEPAAAPVQTVQVSAPAAGREAAPGPARIEPVRIWDLSRRDASGQYATVTLQLSAADREMYNQLAASGCQLVYAGSDAQGAGRLQVWTSTGGTPQCRGEFSVRGSGQSEISAIIGSGIRRFLGRVA